VSLILLLDLDDTLLENNIDVFLPAYLQVLSSEAARYIAPEKFTRALGAGVKAMDANRQPECTLQEVFDSVFFPTIGLPEQELRPFFDWFYREVFPTLQPLTRPSPHAVAFVEEALGRGYRLAISTNPLFPRAAIEQRLAWANLPVDQYPFELVSSYETFHFSKSSAAFFAEVLGRLSWPAEPAIVVGDDLQRDIAGARQLGLPAFWIGKNGVSPGAVAPSGSGGLADLIPWLERTPQEALQPDYQIPTALEAILRSTPAVLDSLCRKLPDELWECCPEVNEWCLTEILCHLRDVDLELNLPRIQKVLSEDNPFIPGIDTDAWAQQRLYSRQNGRQALQDYTAARLRILARLETMRPEDWQRPARHTIFGPTPLIELIDIIAGHDRLHIKQVQQACTLINSDLAPGG
jgi:FMN phosphatase YigB (HAD superfamily)